MSSPLEPGATVGVFGGGQLGRLLAIAAAKLGLKCRIFCEKADAPAFDVASSHVCAPYQDDVAVEEFAAQCDVITFEFENVPADALRLAAAQSSVFPPPEALRTTQDRLSEKTLMDQLSIPVAPYSSIDSLSELEAAAKTIGRPAILKTRRFGYDGKGQVRLDGNSDLAASYRAIGESPAILEGFVEFTTEVSIVAARSRDGEMVFYDLAENRHENQILAETKVPATVDAEVVSLARDTAAKVGDALDYTGVLAIEFFHCSGNEPLLVNEIAPRVHNSGHWTLDGCSVSQFENHIRAIAGWPLGSTERHCDATMTNLIGADVDAWPTYAAQPGLSLYLYGKREARAGRKMGHFTRLKPR